MPKKQTQKKAPAAQQKAKTVTRPTGPGKVVKKKPAKSKPKKRDNPLFEKRPRNFGIGGAIQPKRDLTRFVRWPKYIKIQRQRRVLLKRLKVPGVINQFNSTIDKHTAATLLNFLEKYAPETKKQKKQRLLGLAKAKGAGATGDAKKRPKFIKCGLKHVTSLVESRAAKLVVIAHDVDPIELVLWLPTLCRKKGIPYLIIKGKARLGKVVHKKTATCLAITEVDQKDAKDLGNFIEKAVENFNNRLVDNMKVDGGGVMGFKHNTKKAKEEKRRAKEKKGKE